jgi:threonine dehydrogenase-like Zn-dependent dehydrogenase
VEEADVPSMKALVKEGRSLGLRRLPVPRPRGDEFAGVAVESGTRVAVMPAIPCGTCRACDDPRGALCPRPSMLGVDRDGAFAEFVSVPARAIHPLPDGVSFAEGAYAEPIAAAMAVLKAGLRTEERGLVYGTNRIARLVVRVLKAHGFQGIEVFDGRAPARDRYDFVIETLPTAEAFAAMIDAVRPGGRIILKSRPHGPVAIDLAAAVKKEVTFQAVAYVRFSEALDLLGRRGLDLTDLVGPARPLEDFERVLSEAGRDESFKSFFSPADGHVRDC